MEDVLLFQNYLFQKQSSPFSVAEGQEALYTVRLDGPPPNDVAITVSQADNFVRCIVCVAYIQYSIYYMNEIVYVNASSRIQDRFTVAKC